MTTSGLCYYNGYIYYTGKDESQTIHLFRMDYDAHNKKEIVTLCNSNEGESVDLRQFHRDNLFYYVVGRDGISDLYRIDMVKDEKSLMYEKKEYGSLEKMNFLDNKVYYQFCIIAADKTMTSTLYQYDWNDNIIDTIEVEDSMTNYICYFGGPDYLFLCNPDKTLYYFDKTKLGTGQHEWIKSEVVK